VFSEAGGHVDVRRCAVLFVELEEHPRFDLAALFAGGDGLSAKPRWLARAAHLAEPMEVTLAQLAVLQGVSSDTPVDLAELERRHESSVLQPLLDAGLLVSDAAHDPRLAECEAAVRDIPWWPPALIAQAGGAWRDIDIEARREAGEMPTSARMVEDQGPAPSHEHRVRPDAPLLGLSAPEHRDFDRLLARRWTCRNFEATAILSASDLSTMLLRVWGAIGTRQLAPGAVAVKKASPAGGGLHAIEAYLLVRRVEGLAPGLYHYLPLRHALEGMREMPEAEAAGLARRFLAGQAWFDDVPVLVVMTARFDRLFWKYRRHAKAWRVLHLDAGHLSQTMYLSAADLGLGAFVTAAVNDRDIEAALGLPPLREGALAIVGFGPPSSERTNVELDGLEPTPAGRLLLSPGASDPAGPGGDLVNP